MYPKTIKPLEKMMITF